MKIKVHLKPVIDSVILSQQELNLSDKEMQDRNALREYVQLYHVPPGFLVVGIIDITK